MKLGTLSEAEKGRGVDRQAPRRFSQRRACLRTSLGAVPP